MSRLNKLNDSAGGEQSAQLVGDLFAAANRFGILPDASLSMAMDRMANAESCSIRSPALTHTP